MSGVALILGYPSVSLFEHYIIDDPKAFCILAGIVFDHNVNDSNGSLPPVVKYQLRFSYFQKNFIPGKNIFFQDDIEGWCTSFLYPLNPCQEPREFPFADGGSPGYNKEGFLAIQYAVDKAIMWYHAHSAMTNMFENLNVLVKRFPYGPYIEDRFFLVLQNEFSLFFILSFMCIELIIINSIVLEKEKRLKVTPATSGVCLSWDRNVGKLLMKNDQNRNEAKRRLLRCPSNFQGTGIQWRNMGSVCGEFNFTQVLLDSFLYYLIAWYVESIFPGKYGTPKPWYFFAVPSYWHGKPVPVTQSLLDMRVPVKTPNSKFIEKEPTDLIKGIEIQHLYKVYHRGRTKHIAVKCLTMNM
nr:ATP-binding cassette sub-family A member 17-like [Pongo pygmaeus]